MNPPRLEYLCIREIYSNKISCEKLPKIFLNIPRYLKVFFSKKKELENDKKALDYFTKLINIYTEYIETNNPKEFQSLDSIIYLEYLYKKHNKILTDILLCLYEDYEVNKWEALNKFGSPVEILAADNYFYNKYDYD